MTNFGLSIFLNFHSKFLTFRLFYLVPAKFLFNFECAKFIF